MRILFFLLLLYSSFAIASTPHSFAEAEHAAAGDAVKLYLPNCKGGMAGYILQLPNGLKATYGEILTFGDVYGTPHRPISVGETAKTRRDRFLKAFHNFATDPNVLSEVNQILGTVHDEQKKIADAIAHGQTPKEAYRNQKSETARHFNCITGGGCDPKTWWLKQGRFLELAKWDFDHFGDNAWLAYKTGHEIALEEAVAANRENNPKRLELAYAMNAFASHFLTDRFSTGHIRTPRVTLTKKVCPPLIGSLLASFMHNEENDWGLHVHNEFGQRWMAFGDGNYFEKKSQKQREVLHDALQASADEIFFTYVIGVPFKLKNVHHYIPIPDETGYDSRLDATPLFHWDEAQNKLMRRQDVHNPLDHHWTSDWWGWTTLGLLIKTHGGLGGMLQTQLANSDYAEQAVKDGFITEPSVLEYIKANKLHKK